LRRKESRRLTWLILFLVCCGIPLAVVAAFSNNAVVIVAAIGFVAIYVYLFHVTYDRRKKLRYPIVPPEGKADIYSRASIPRPIHEDFRRMQEKKKRFAKLNRLRRRMNKKKV